MPNLVFCSNGQGDPKACHSLTQWVVGRAYGLRVGTPTSTPCRKKESLRVLTFCSRYWPYCNAQFLSTRQLSPTMPVAFWGIIPFSQLYSSSDSPLGPPYTTDLASDLWPCTIVRAAFSVIHKASTLLSFPRYTQYGVHHLSHSHRG